MTLNFSNILCHVLFALLQGVRFIRINQVKGFRVVTQFRSKNQLSTLHRALYIQILDPGLRYKDEKVLGTQSSIAHKLTSTHCVPHPSFISKSSSTLSSIHTRTHAQTSSQYPSMLSQPSVHHITSHSISSHIMAYHLIQANNHTYLLCSSHNITPNSYSISPSHTSHVHLKQTCMFILIYMHLPHYITTTPHIQMHDM